MDRPDKRQRTVKTQRKEDACGPWARQHTDLGESSLTTPQPRGQTQGHLLDSSIKRYVAEEIGKRPGVFSGTPPRY